MEDTLREHKERNECAPCIVLILVLMEDTLRELYNDDVAVDELYVLILVLMEDTLRVAQVVTMLRLAQVLILVLMEDTLRGLMANVSRLIHSIVLILVLMEHTLRDVKNFDKAAIARS